METEPFFLDPDYANAFADDGSFDRDALKITTLPLIPYFFGVIMVVGIAITVLVIFVTQLFPYMASVREDRAYEREGVAVDLTVLHCAMEDVDGEGKRPHVYYMYTVASERYEGIQVLNKWDSCDSYPDNSVFEGEYLSGDPQTSRLAINLTLAEKKLYFGHDMGAVFYSIIGFVQILSLIFYIQHYIKVHNRYNRLIASGQVLDGEILEMTGKVVDSLTKKVYQVKAVYAFTTPLNVDITVRQYKIRDDLRDKKLPRKGTPVRVLYADDDAYVML